MLVNGLHLGGREGKGGEGRGGEGKGRGKGGGREGRWMLKGITRLHIVINP